VHLSVVGVDVTRRVQPETHFVLSTSARDQSDDRRGQLVVAVVQGLGQRRWRACLRPERPALTGTFMDSNAAANGAPAVELMIEEAAAPSNPLGVKEPAKLPRPETAPQSQRVASAVGAERLARLPVTARGSRRARPRVTLPG